MKIHKHGFIGHESTNITEYWENSNSQSLFYKNCAEMPPNWYFRNVEISYKYNSLGHRSPEIQNINLDNYILCTGCSHTEGIGMENDKIYPNLLAKKLNTDCYNLGLGATGIDVVLHNLVIWFSVVPKKPKVVVIQWPDFTRMLTGTTPENLQTRGLWAEDDNYNKFVNLAIELGYLESKKILAHHIVQSLIDVPVVYFGLEKVIPFDDNTIIVPTIDKARDLGHPGIKSHELFADSIHEHLINTGCLNFYQSTEPKN